jgi:hypothetical protein
MSQRPNPYVKHYGLVKLTFSLETGPAKVGIFP